MATDDTGTETEWEGWSDYQRVGDRVARSVHNAVEAYAILSARHAENARIKPDVAADARAKILAPALRLKTEMAINDDRFEETLADWQGEDGYIAQLREIQLQHQCPSWLPEFVEDIRKVGWELGYLQAGRTVKKEPEDPTERDTEAMFDNL